MNRQTGSTLLEVLVVAALLIPIIALMMTGTDRATQTMAQDETIAKTMEGLQRSAIRISHVVRPCSLGTYRMAANQEDVNALRAAAVGEWIEPEPGLPRTGIRFRAASGTLYINAAALTAVRTVQFRLEPGETQNGVDDDGDGLIDEGDVVYDQDGTEVLLTRNVERCTFALTDRTLVIELRAGARRKDGQVQRFTARQTLYLRNN